MQYFVHLYIWCATVQSLCAIFLCQRRFIWSLRPASVSPGSTMSQSRCVCVSFSTIGVEYITKMSNIWIRHELGKVCVFPPRALIFFSECDLTASEVFLVYEVLKSSSVFLATSLKIRIKKGLFFEGLDKPVPGIHDLESQASTVGADERLKLTKMTFSSFSVWALPVPETKI